MQMERKILLINPPMCNTNTADNAYRHPPLGLMYLASYVKQFGYQADILDFSMYGAWREMLDEKLGSQSYHLIGISGTTPTHDNIGKIACRVKFRSPDSYIIAGGPHVTFIGGEIIEKTPVDVVIKGEGEIALFKLLCFYFEDKKKLIDIPGIIFKNEEGNVIDTGNPEMINDLDSIPFPDWSNIDMSQYANINFPVITSRGCPGRCIFCSANAMSNGSYRRRSNKNIISELIYLYENYGINSFLFADNTFTGKRKQVVDLCNEFMELKFKPNWYCESRLDVLTPELVSIMANSGCKGVQIGIESGNQEILNIINKNIYIGNIIEKMKQIKDSGMESIYCTFVFGLPGENEKTLEETLKLIEQLYNMGVVIETTLSTPFPGTYLAENAEQLGIRIKHKNWKMYLFNEVTSIPINLDEKLLRNYFVESRKFCS